MERSGFGEAESLLCLTGVHPWAWVLGNIQLVLCILGLCMGNRPCPRSDCGASPLAGLSSASIPGRELLSDFILPLTHRWFGEDSVSQKGGAAALVSKEPVLA